MRKPVQCPTAAPVANKITVATLYILYIIYMLDLYKGLAGLVDSRAAWPGQGSCWRLPVSIWFGAHAAKCLCLPADLAPPQPANADGNSQRSQSTCQSPNLKATTEDLKAQSLKFTLNLN